MAFFAGDSPRGPALRYIILHSYALCSPCFNNVAGTFLRCGVLEYCTFASGGMQKPGSGPKA